MSTRTHFVYRAWDAEGRLLYIGLSKDVPKRLKQHHADASYQTKYGAPPNSHWVHHVDRITSMGPYPKETAAALERAAIDAENSYFNPSRAEFRHGTEWRAARKRLNAEAPAHKLFNIFDPVGRAASAEHNVRIDAEVDRLMGGPERPDYLARYMDDLLNHRFRDHGSLTRAAA